MKRNVLPVHRLLSNLAWCAASLPGTGYAVICDYPSHARRSTGFTGVIQMGGCWRGGCWRGGCWRGGCWRGGFRTRPYYLRWARADRI